MKARALFFFSSWIASVAAPVPVGASESEHCARARQPLGGPERTTEAFYAAELRKPADDRSHEPITPQRDRDECFLEDKVENWIFGSMVVRAAAGASNGVFDSTSIGQRAVGELDETTFQYKIEAGWSQRPLFRDVYLLTGSGRLDAYRDKAFDPFRVLVLDAFKFTLIGGWGTTIEPNHQKGRFTTAEDLIFDLSVNYEIPLEKIGFPFRE